MNTLMRIVVLGLAMLVGTVQAADPLVISTGTDDQRISRLHSTDQHGQTQYNDSHQGIHRPKSSGLKTARRCR